MVKTVTECANLVWVYYYFTIFSLGRRKIEQEVIPSCFLFVVKVDHLKIPIWALLTHHYQQKVSSSEVDLSTLLYYYFQLG